MLSIPKTISKTVKVKRDIQASGVAKNSIVMFFCHEDKKSLDKFIEAFTFILMIGLSKSN
ncbi:hypothetical protein D9M68_556130 [compost metagenome]